MYWPLLLMAAWPFYLFLLAFVVCVVWSLERENGPAATFVVVLSAAILVAFSDFPVAGMLAWAGSHITTLLLYVAGYVVAGGAWAFVKWYFFSLNKADYIEQNLDTGMGYRSTYTRVYAPGTSGSTDKYATLADYLQSLAPKPMENKSRIYLWMTYWPCSALWTIINDPLKRIYRFFLEMMSGLMTKVSVKVFNRRFSNIK